MTQLPASLASRQRRSIIDDAVQGLGASRGAHVSIRGGRFRLIGATGDEKLIDTHYLDVIVIDANDKPSRIYFEGDYDPTSDTPPACFSDNGVGPSTQAMSPQAPTCAVCQHNVRGTKTTFTGKTTTACENRKKIAVIIPDDPAINVYEFQIPPGSLTNLKAYTNWIRQQASGVQGRAMDIADFVTRVEFDPDRQFVMKFTPVAFADDERTLQLIEYVDANKLSDAAVGRNDVACEPEAVNRMLASAGARPAIAPPPAAPAQAAQPFQMPQRQVTPLVPQPPAQFVPPPPPMLQQAPPPAATPPKPRGRKQQQIEASPQAASPAAPFMAPAASAPSTNPAPQANGAAGGGPELDIPPFLRRADSPPPAPSAPPRFGIAQPPAPPAEIQSAVAQAMSLDLPKRSA